ncbi:MAG: DNA double-strand break repair nuclease NurA, partial [Chloroflexota bacterium]
MATFTDKFIGQVELRREDFSALFSSGRVTPVEERLGDRIEANWHPLDEPGHGAPPAPGAGTGVFAIDGSEATRNFSNAAWLIVGQALLIGPGTEIPTLELRLVPGNVPNAVVDSYASRLMRWLELRLALDHIGRFAGRTLILDGSIYSTLPHLLYPLNELQGQPGCAEDADLPLRLIEAYLDLFDACRQQDILLLGVSKTTQDRVLTTTLLRLPDDLDVVTADMADHADDTLSGRIPPDA